MAKTDQEISLNRCFQGEPVFFEVPINGEPLSPQAGPVCERHNLSTDPEERCNPGDQNVKVIAQLQPRPERPASMGA